MNKYTVATMDDHMVARWANVPITQVGELPYLDYLLYRRDAFIDQMNSTEDGVKYLDDAWLLEQTKPDREASRRFSNGG